MATSNGNPGFVLFRRSADCSSAVEAHFHESGAFWFRGSAEEPDPARRAKFLEQNGQWRNLHGIVAQTSCEHLEDLLRVVRRKA